MRIVGHIIVQGRPIQRVDYSLHTSYTYLNWQMTLSESVNNDENKEAYRMENGEWRHNTSAQ